MGIAAPNVSLHLINGTPMKGAYYEIKPMEKGNVAGMKRI
jgi:hypothetical protein